LARGDASGARATLTSADRLFSQSKDARLLLWRDLTLAGVLHAMGREEEADSTLNHALDEAHRLGFAGLTLEIRLASVQPAAPQLAQDAQQAGFLLIARKARP